MEEITTAAREEEEEARRQARKIRFAEEDEWEVRLEEAKKGIKFAPDEEDVKFQQKWAKEERCRLEERYGVLCEDIQHIHESDAQDTEILRMSIHAKLAHYEELVKELDKLNGELEEVVSKMDEYEMDTTLGWKLLY